MATDPESPAGPIPRSHPEGLIPGGPVPWCPPSPLTRAAEQRQEQRQERDGAGAHVRSRESAPSAGGGSGRKPTPFGGGSAAEEMPLAALGPGRRGRGGGEDEPPLPRRRRASVSPLKPPGKGRALGPGWVPPRGSQGLGIGVLVGSTHPNYSRAAPSDEEGAGSGDGERATPDIQPPVLPVLIPAGSWGSGCGCPMALHALSGGSPRAPLPALPVPLARPQMGLPGHPSLAGGLGDKLGTRGSG